jgi:hypothetical protein
MNELCVQVETDAFTFQSCRSWSFECTSEFRIPTVPSSSKVVRFCPSGTMEKLKKGVGFYCLGHSKIQRAVSSLTRPRDSCVPFLVPNDLGRATEGQTTWGNIRADLGRAQVRPSEPRSPSSARGSDDIAELPTSPRMLPPVPLILSAAASAASQLGRAPEEPRSLGRSSPGSWGDTGLPFPPHSG